MSFVSLIKLSITWKRKDILRITDFINTLDDRITDVKEMKEGNVHRRNGYSVVNVRIIYFSLCGKKEGSASVITSLLEFVFIFKLLWTFLITDSWLFVIRELENLAYGEQITMIFKNSQSTHFIFFHIKAPWGSNDRHNMLSAIIIILFSLLKPFQRKYFSGTSWNIFLLPVSF